MDGLFNEDLDRQSDFPMSQRKPSKKTADMVRLENLLDETDAEVSLQKELRSADSLERGVSTINAPSPLAMRTVQIASTPDDFEKEHVVKFEPSISDVSQNLSARLDEAETTPRKRELSMSELGDEAEDTKGAIENIFDDIQEKTAVSNQDDEGENESILTTPGRERSWERLNKMYAQHGFSETPIFVSEDDRVRVDVKLLIDSTRALFEKYEERGDLIQQMAGDVKRAESRMSERDLASSQNSARSERTIRQQTNLTSQLRERVRHLEKQLDLERKERRTLEKRAERTKREFKQQLKYSKHAARVHERTADKLKEKLRKEYERQSSLKTRGQELLRQHRVSSSPASATNTAMRTPSSSKQKMRDIHASFLGTSILQVRSRSNPEHQHTSRTQVLRCPREVRDREAERC